MGRPAIGPGEMGTPSAKHDGSRWVGRVRWRDTFGAYHETRRPAGTKKSALALVVAAAQREQEANKRRIGIEAGHLPTLGEVAEQWFAALEQEGEVRCSTIAQYQATWKSLGQRRYAGEEKAPLFRELRIADMSRGKSMKHLNSLVRLDRNGKPVETKDGKTIRLRGKQPRTVLYMLFEYALDQGLIEKNHLVMKRKKNGSGKKSKKGKVGPRALTTREWETLRDIAERRSIGHHRRTRDFLDAAIIMRYTGARIGEALALRWEDLSLRSDPPRVHIHKTLLDPRPGVTELTGDTKGDEERLIVLHPEAVEYLTDRWLERGKPRSGFVFATGKNGLPVSTANLRARWRAALKGTELEWVHPHSLRHTYATLASRTLMDDQAVADLLGHNDRGETARRHYIERDGITYLDPRLLFEDPEEGPEAVTGE